MLLSDFYRSMRFLSCTSSEEMEHTGAMEFLVKNVLLELDMIFRFYFSSLLSFHPSFLFVSISLHLEPNLI